jgi:N-acyl-D-amino-acid deacylase
MTWDIVIHRGLLIDGSGSQGTIADIALAAGRIAAIGPSLPGEASKVIDAEGLAVTPGFIDIKTHSDFVLPINPKAESKVRQGVTTEIISHCGFSVAPVLRQDAAPRRLPERRRTVAAVPGNGLSEYLDTFPALPSMRACWSGTTRSDSW